MFCPDCGTYAESNYCPHCGYDLRKVPQKRISKGQVQQEYRKYLKFYPDKLAAIRALRVDTGMKLVDANAIIDALFRDEPIPESTVERQRKEKERQQKAQKAVKTVGKGVGFAAFATGYTGLKVISGLVKGRSRRR